MKKFPRYNWESISPLQRNLPLLNMDPDYKISTENNASDDSSEIVDTQNETICEETYVTYEYAELPGKKK